MNALQYVMLVLFLFVGIIGCDSDNSTSSPTYPYDLEVELSWNSAVNMDLWVVEPNGQGSGHGDPGITAINIGDNDCGFGDACSADSCSDLPCNTAERIFVNSGDALPATTEPIYDYQIGFSNWSDVTTEMTLTITTLGSTSKTFHCTVDGPRVTYIANVSFPDGTIEEITSFTDSYCY